MAERVDFTLEARLARWLVKAPSQACTFAGHPEYGGCASAALYRHPYEGSWHACASWSSNKYVWSEMSASPTDTVLQLIDLLRDNASALRKHAK